MTCGAPDSTEKKKRQLVKRIVGLGKNIQTLEKQIAAFKAEGNDQLAAILETGAVSRRRPKYWRTYAVRFGAWLDKTLLGQSGVKEAIDTAAKEVEKAIAEGGEL